MSFCSSQRDAFTETITEEKKYSKKCRSSEFYSEKPGSKIHWTADRHRLRQMRNSRTHLQMPYYLCSRWIIRWIRLKILRIIITIKAYDT